MKQIFCKKDNTISLNLKYKPFFNFNLLFPSSQKKDPNNRFDFEFLSSVSNRNNSEKVKRSGYMNTEDGRTDPKNLGPKLDCSITKIQSKKPSEDIKGIVKKPSIYIKPDGSPATVEKPQQRNLKLKATERNLGNDHPNSNILSKSHDQANIPPRNHKKFFNTPEQLQYLHGNKNVLHGLSTDYREIKMLKSTKTKIPIEINYYQGGALNNLERNRMFNNQNHKDQNHNSQNHNSQINNSQNHNLQNHNSQNYNVQNHNAQNPEISIFQKFLENRNKQALSETAIITKKTQASYMEWLKNDTTTDNGSAKNTDITGQSTRGLNDINGKGTQNSTNNANINKYDNKEEQLSNYQDTNTNTNKSHNKICENENCECCGSSNNKSTNNIKENNKSSNNIKESNNSNVKEKESPHNNLQINSCVGNNPAYQDKYGNFFFPSLSRAKKKARKAKVKTKIINDLSNYATLGQGPSDPIQLNEKIDTMGRYYINSPLCSPKFEDKDTQKRSKKAYLLKRLNMAKLLFNTQIPHKDVKAIEDLYLEKMDEVREDSLLKCKGDFVIQRIEDFNKIEVIPTFPRKNTPVPRKWNKSLQNSVICGNTSLNNNIFDKSEPSNYSNDQLIITSSNYIKNNDLPISDDLDPSNVKWVYQRVLTEADREIFKDEQIPIENFIEIQESTVQPQNLKKSKVNSIDRDQPNTALSNCITGPRKKKGDKKLLKFGGLNKDMSLEDKFSFFHDFRNKMNLSNRLIVTTEETNNNYKFYIAKGNNGNQIKECLKRRWWWTSADDLEKDGPMNVNLVWTQKIKRFVQDRKKEGRSNKNKFCCLLTKEKNKSKVIEEYLNLHTKVVNQGDYQIIYNLQIEKLSSYFSIDQLTDEIEGDEFQNFEAKDFLITNHFEMGCELGDKINLLKNMKIYYEKDDRNVFEYMPLTFIANYPTDPSFLAFVEHYKILETAKIESAGSFRNQWIVKPGEDSNRGRGVYVMDNITKIKDLMRLNNFSQNGDRRSFIIQKYIECPLQYKGRKFDIRVFMLITWMNGRIRAYYYEPGYVRTSSKEFNQTNIDNRFIHLTNEAVQKKADGWGKFESGNKQTFEEQSKYIDLIQAGRDSDEMVSFEKDIFPKIKSLTLDTVKATYKKLNPENKNFAFEQFGLDYMIDHLFQVWLIEVNTNPCQSCLSPVTCKLIPHMVENLQRQVVDPIFPPPKKAYKTKKAPPETILEQNKFELFFAVD